MCTCKRKTTWFRPTAISIILILAIGINTEGNGTPFVCNFDASSLNLFIINKENISFKRDETST